MRTKTIATAAALWLGMAATTAQAATASCVTETEAQALVLAIAPDAIDAIGQKCGPQLAPTAILRAGLSALVGKYRTAADAAWPVASAAIVKVSGNDAKGMDPTMLRGMMGPMIGQMATEKIAPKDCVTVDRILTQLEPLPPANTANVLVLFAEIAMQNGKAGKAPLTICPAIPISSAK